MVVPLGMTVVLEITADDVAHSWWIPGLGGKQDALPGYVNKTWFKPIKTGIFTGQCAELCGRNHANMTAQVEVVEFPAYQRWYRQRANDVESAQQEQATQRAQIEREQGTGAGATTNEE
jgi:cytochrome c oxidase subunit 2